MSWEFRDTEEEILELTKKKPEKRAFVLKQLQQLNHSLIMLRAEKLHGKEFLKVGAEKERIWIPLWEYRSLKRKPKRIDFMIPMGYSLHFNNLLPLKGWTYFAQIDNCGKDRYWKVRDKGKWAVTE